MKTSAELLRAPSLAGQLLSRIRAYSGPPITVMEVCGTHTVAIARMGLRSLLPEGVRLLSGPGCPVCVTPVGILDQAIHLAENEGIVLATYGDALRVPGSSSTLAEARARGADVRIVYSAADALGIARSEPAQRVAFLGLGFETTSPTVAWVLRKARAEGVANFSVLSAHKALLPAMDVLLKDPEVSIGAFLCPGHASMVLGVKGYRRLAEEYAVPCVVAGFEPNEVLLGLARILEQAERGEARVENAYPRAVAEEGNPAALSLLDEVFRLETGAWRGLGPLPESAYALRPDWEEHDAARWTAGRTWEGREPAGCRCAEVLRGRIGPGECPLFGTRCTPETPVGACMVSSEGACGAHHRYREA